MSDIRPPDFPVLDLPLLRKVMDQITAVAETPMLIKNEDNEVVDALFWDQGVWRSNRFFNPNHGEVTAVARARGELVCGTAMCMAGWTAELCSDEVEWVEDDDVVHLEDGRKQAVYTWAKDRLGLTGVEADALFDGSNTLEDLEGLVKQLEHGNTINEIDRGDGDCDCHICRNEP